MDNAQYHQNAMSASNSPYPSMTGASHPGISPHQLQQNHGMPTHTLPPLQATQHAHATMQSLYGGGSAPHTPRTPATPNTPNSANTMGGNFPQMGVPQARGYQMMPGSYQQPPQQYRTSAPMMPQSTTAMSHPQAIAPAPAQVRMPQTLRPMPPNGLHPMGNMQGGYGQNNMMMPHEMEPPTHVVGSQGRRGILPSAPGRPAVAATGPGATKNTLIPAKDADGKFPCPHCTKTYLHAKHLKRHLLRHTGDRPYMCVLCRDTFSRSDILKRHFQKCSIRRGNPTGASHLSHAQAHLKKAQPAHKATPSMSNPNDMMGLAAMNSGMHNGMTNGMNNGMNNGLNNGMNNGMNNVINNGMNNLSNNSVLPFGVDPNGSIPDAGSNLTDEQAEQMQRNEMKRLGAGDGGNRRSITGPSPGGSNRASFDQSYAGSIASTMPSGMNPPLAFMSNDQNGHSYSQGYDYASHGNGNHMQSQSVAGQQHGLNWATQMYQSNIPENLGSQYNSNVATPQMSVKSETSNPATSGFFNSMYPNVSNDTTSPSNLPSWNIHSSNIEQISDKLLCFCFPANAILSSRDHNLRNFLSVEYIGHFLEHFYNFQVHFPVIHFPSFRKADAYEGLLLSMVCLGAVYSDRITATQVREMTEVAKAVIERQSRLFAIVSQEQSGNAHPLGTIGSSTAELDEITAIFMMNVLATWNGTPLQREKARQQFPLLVQLVRRAGLTIPLSGTPHSSALHQQNVAPENFNSANFDWSTWVEQEKRSRIVYAIYLSDAAMVIYFNSIPLFEPLEIRLPLPADDAAWDARNATECAEALGLHGPAAQVRNSHGSRRLKQPEMHSALKALMHPLYDLQPGTTNLYSKFVLVHALHVQLWTTSKQILQETSQMNGHNVALFPGSGTVTPISQNDWVMRGGVSAGGSGPPSATNSGRATPVDGIQSAQSLKTLGNAFEKWKKAWDEDMSQQYPPSSIPKTRLGFCRDGVHFYWLAKHFLSNSHGVNLHMAPDQRFTAILQLLKRVKSWAMSDSAQRGEDLGSVSEIDMNYGVTDLTLDMSQLFKAINSHRNSPSGGVHPINGNVLS